MIRHCILKRWEIHGYQNQCFQMIWQSCLIHLNKCIYVGHSFSSFIGLIGSPLVHSVLWYIIMQIGFMIVFLNEIEMCLSWAAQVFSKRPPNNIYIYVIVWQQVKAIYIRKSTTLSSVLSSFDYYICWKVTLYTNSWFPTTRSQNANAIFHIFSVNIPN